MGETAGSVSGDEDWFEFQADKTGAFRFQALFDTISTLGNGRPGLAGQGALDIGLYSETGDLIAQATSGANASNDISVAAGKRYFARVDSAAGADLRMTSLWSIPSVLRDRVEDRETRELEAEDC